MSNDKLDKSNIKNFNHEFSNNTKKINNEELYDDNHMTKDTLDNINTTVGTINTN